jgi:hypothetical protein
LFFLISKSEDSVELADCGQNDNVGALIMSQNSLNCGRVWHVDRRYHVIHEIMKMEFVILIDNDSDILTKKVNQSEIRNLNERYRIWRVLEISLTLNHNLVYIFWVYPLGIF